MMKKVLLVLGAVISVFFLGDDCLATAPWSTAAVESLKQGSDAGDPNAKYELASRYFSGEGVKRNLSEGFKLIKEAADGGHLGAKCSLAACYEYGTCVAKDRVKAFELYKQAADEGHRSSKYWLAFYYRDGKVVERDLEQAVRLFREAGCDEDEVANELERLCLWK